MASKWYQLSNFKCPVGGCVGSQQAANWVCAKDGTDMYISQTGYLRCSHVEQRKYSHFGQICTWGFDCGNHGNHPVHRYKQADLQGFSFALSHALQLVSEAGAVWCAALILELGKQYENVDDIPQSTDPRKVSCRIKKGGKYDFEINDGLQRMTGLDVHTVV